MSEDLVAAFARAHAHLAAKLDDELGRLHGLSHNDFRLLQALLSAPDAGLPATAIARMLDVAPSVVVKQAISLEKIGLLSRVAVAGNQGRGIVLTAAGQSLAREASTTASWIAKDMESSVPPAVMEGVRGFLRELATHPSLAIWKSSSRSRPQAAAAR